MKKLESETDLSTFLGHHEIGEDYRAKMIDWMVEVLQAYHMSEQSFFIAVNILDRFFKNMQKSLPSSELHLTGMVAMFISSKYEDMSPLLMKTVVNKIGHGKYSLK